MTTPHLDLYKKDARGNLVWLDTVCDRETARFRLAELASAFPGEYFAFDQITHKIMGLGLDQIECT